MEYILLPLETPYSNQPSYVLPLLGCQYEYPKQCVYNWILESTSQTNSSHKHSTIIGTTAYPADLAKTLGWVISPKYSTFRLSVNLAGSLSSQYSQKLCNLSSIPLLILCDLSVWTTITAPRTILACNLPNSIFQIVVVMIKKINSSNVLNQNPPNGFLSQNKIQNSYHSPTLSDTRLTLTLFLTSLSLNYLPATPASAAQIFQPYWPTCGFLYCTGHSIFICGIYSAQKAPFHTPFSYPFESLLVR